MLGRRQIGILLFCLLFSGLAAAQQGNPKTFKEVLRESLDSVVLAHGFALHEVTITGDSNVRRALDEYISSDPKAILYVQYFQQRGDYREGQMHVHGTFLSIKPPKSAEHISFVTARIGPQIVEIKQIERESLKKEEEPDFWESVLQPTLVTLGAATIIALFFLIRS